MTRTLLLSCLVLASGCVDTSWRPAFDAAESGWLLNTWGTSADARWAVGGSFAEGRALRFDGQAWADHELPAGTPLLNWIHGVSADDAWAVGADGVILRWEGDAWRTVVSPTDQDLWGVWAAASDDVYAVGGTARRPSEALPTVIHYDGADWSVVELPALMRENVDAFFKVWGSGAADVYVVGDRGIVMHFDGATWEELFVGATDDLVAVWGTGPDDVVAVGGRSNGIVAWWNGVEWQNRELAPIPGLNGVFLRRPGVAHLVGNLGTIARFDTSTGLATEVPVREALDFHAVHGVDGQLVAVGGNLAVPSSPEGIAWTRPLSEEE